VIEKLEGIGQRAKGIGHGAYRRIRKWECGMRKKRLGIQKSEKGKAHGAR
jgi:hypothetical protein